MLITAVSFGRMGALYPSAGSAYTYVGRGLNPHLRFLAGWAMILEYLVIPIGSIGYGVISAAHVVDGAISAVQVVDDFLPGFNHGIAAALHLQFAEAKVVTAV